MAQQLEVLLLRQGKVLMLMCNTVKMTASHLNRSAIRPCSMVEMDKPTYCHGIGSIEYVRYIYNCTTVTTVFKNNINTGNFNITRKVN